MSLPPPPGPPPYGYPRPPAKHPQATTVLVLGILGLVACQLLAPFAWYQGNRVLEEIRTSRSPLSGESEANIGKILGLVGSILLIITLALVAVMFLVPVILIPIIAATV